MSIWVGSESVELIQAADWLGKYILERLITNGISKDPHKRAIIVTQLAAQVLQMSYKGEQSLGSIMLETADILQSFTTSRGNA